MWGLLSSLFKISDLPVCLRLAAIALLVLQSEEDAFWCLVTVVETIMPQDYYTKNLVASQVQKYTHLFTCSPVL